MKERLTAAAGALLMLYALGWAHSIHANDRKDIVFITSSTCEGDTVQCARQLHFNGDWRGTQLCRAGKCVAFEEVFNEKRH